MVTLNEEMTIASPPDRVWPLLSDPGVVASCIPGAELSADDDGMWRGTIRVKFGPTVAQFRGEATLEFDDEARRVTVDGRGIDGRGASRALARSVVELHGEDTTVMKVAGEFTVSGPLGTFVDAGGVQVARALLEEFCTNMAAVVESAAPGGPQGDPAPQERPGTDGGAAPGPPVQAAGADAHGSAGASAATGAQPSRTSELGAFALLWRVLVGSIKKLFGKERRTHE